MKEKKSSYSYKSKKRLDGREQLELFKKVKEGNIDARNELITKSMGLVVYEIKKRFSSLPIDNDDLISIGAIGLIKSVDHFDYSLGITFSSFALKCIDNEILMYYRKNKNNLYNLSINKPLSIDERGNEMSINDTLVDENVNLVDDYEKLEEYRLVDKIINSLPDKYRKIILLHYGFLNEEIYNQQEIASMLDISQSAVSKQIKKILSKIEYEYIKTNPENVKKYLKTK